MKTQNFLYIALVSLLMLSTVACSKDEGKDLFSGEMIATYSSAYNGTYDYQATSDAFAIKVTGTNIGKQANSKALEYQYSIYREDDNPNGSGLTLSLAPIKFEDDVIFFTVDLTENDSKEARIFEVYLTIIVDIPHGRMWGGPGPIKITQKGDPNRD